MFASYSQVELHDWNGNHYTKYNYTSFQSLAIVNQKIDINNIDYELFNAGDLLLY